MVKDAQDSATRFFDLPADEKMHLVSDNFQEPVRYGTSINHSTDRVHYWREDQSNVINKRDENDTSVVFLKKLGSILDICVENEDKHLHMALYLFYPQ